MVELRISTANPRHIQLGKRLEELSLARTVTEDRQAGEPILRHGKEVYRGEQTVSEYIDSLSTLMEQWYECRCDKYENL